MGYQNRDLGTIQDSIEKATVNNNNYQEKISNKIKDGGKPDAKTAISNEKNIESIEATESLSSLEKIRHNKEIRISGNNPDSESSFTINEDITNEHILESSTDRGDENKIFKKDFSNE